MENNMRTKGIYTSKGEEKMKVEKQDGEWAQEKSRKCLLVLTAAGTNKPGNLLTPANMVSILSY